MSRVRPTSALQFARMTFALAGGVVLALYALANSAQAGCGDYVFVRNASGQLVRASSLMKDHQGGDCTGPNCPDFNREGTASKDRIPAERQPCKGPNCSERSDLPASPAPPVPPRSGQESTALLLQVNDGDDEAGARFGGVSSSTDHELHFPQTIFHPPR